MTVESYLIYLDFLQSTKDIVKVIALSACALDRLDVKRHTNAEFPVKTVPACALS